MIQKKFQLLYDNGLAKVSKRDEEIDKIACLNQDLLESFNIEF